MNLCSEYCEYYAPDNSYYRVLSGANWGYFGNYGAPYVTNATAAVNVSAVAGGTLLNSGRIGYAVQSTVDRYYVTPDGAYSAIATTTMPSIAPTQSYNKSVALPQGANAASYTTLIIDPFNTTQIYDYTNDTVNGLPVSAYVYVAPLQAQ